MYKVFFAEAEMLVTHGLFKFSEGVLAHVQHNEFSAGFEESHYDADSHFADYEMELASRMEANVRQAQKRAVVLTASSMKQHRRRPSSADQRFSESSRRTLMEKDQQLSHRSTLAWDEKSTPALGSAPVIYRDGAGGNYLESPEQLPSELDQLHALGDRKYGAGAAFRGTAPPQRKAKRADQRKNPANQCNTNAHEKYFAASVSAAQGSLQMQHLPQHKQPEPSHFVAPRLRPHLRSPFET